ncbi:protein white-like [Glandiceps talaboti]
MDDERSPLYPRLTHHLPDDQGDSESDDETSFASFRFRAPRRSTIFQDQSITLTWDNIAVRTVPKKGWFQWKSNQGESFEGTEIVKGVSGYVKPGMLLAIFGASGSGKSTLLNALTFRTTSDLTVEGSVMANGEIVDSTITSIMGYVQQEDLFFASLTVREQLQFQARLKLDRELTKEERSEKVEEVIRELGLTGCANFCIGNPGSGEAISGGERKRLSVAAEILTDPHLLICDEPTSGLDSYMAETVVSRLKDLAIGGNSIICTLHQPSSEIYEHLDYILIMCAGRCAYMGPTSDAVEYFSKIGYICPSTYNPPDFFIETLSVDSETEEGSTKETICDCFHESRYYNKVQEILHDQMFKSRIRRKSIMKRLKRGSESPYKASWLTQFSILLWRSFIRTIRDKAVMRARIFYVFITTIFVGLAYWQTPNTQTGARDIQGIFFLILIIVGQEAYWQSIGILLSETTIFFREHLSGMYRTDTYFIAKSLSEIPTCLFVAVITGTISYWVTGLNPDLERFFMFLFLIFIIGLAATALGFIVSVVSTTYGFAMALAALIIFPMDLFAGFYLNVASIPVYLRWLEYLSYTRYGYEAMSINQWYKVEDIECDTFGTNNSTCLFDGEAVLDVFNFEPKHLRRDIVMLLVLTVGYQSLAFILLLTRIYLKMGRRKYK